LQAKPALDGDDGVAEAYSELCGLVKGPVAERDGNDKGEDSELRKLVRKAVAEGLLDEDEALAKRWV
jgi:hypothetical protein